MSNMNSLQAVSIEYKRDVMREETRILVDEIGLEQFRELQSLKLRMNRRYLLIDKVCPYFMSLGNQASKLKILDLSDNALGSKEVMLILESIEFVALTKLDMSFNYFGPAASK